MFFSAVTKNLNWDILTNNLVTFKRWDGVKDEKFEYYGSSLKNAIFNGGHEKPIYMGGGGLKRGAWTVYIFKGGLAKKRGGEFLRVGRV